MHIELIPVNRDNYRAVCQLQLLPEQAELLASNLWSLVEAGYEDDYHPHAIYADGRVVGFIMWVRESRQRMSIWRFMVDKDHQQRGIGRQALQLAIGQLRTVGQLREIEICYVPDNPTAAQFYQSLGFVEQGFDAAGEEKLAYIYL